MYKCNNNNCGRTYTVYKIKCPNCQGVGTLRFDEEEPMHPSSVAPIVQANQPINMTLRGFRREEPLSNNNNNNNNNSNIDTRKLDIGDMKGNMNHTSGGVNHFTSNISNAENDVINIHADKGLWCRSIQLKHPECLTAKDIEFNPKDLDRQFCDCWSFAHSDIPQEFFQLAQKDKSGARCIALLVDWRKTTDRYVEYSLQDASSNKTFLKGTSVKPDQCAEHMGKMLENLRGKKTVTCNEVRTCQIKKDALVGLLWGPVVGNSLEPEGKAEWGETRSAIVKLVQTLKDNNIALQGLPIFCYSNSETTQSLDYMDYIV
jgi:hypothetical protein